MAVALGLLVAFCFINSAALAALAVIRYRESGIRRLNKPSTELADFLADIRHHGYGVLRIDPDTVMRRGPQR
jgi:hypothetical protein